MTDNDKTVQDGWVRLSDLLKIDDNGKPDLDPSFNLESAQGCFFAGAAQALNLLSRPVDSCSNVPEAVANTFSIVGEEILVFVKSDY